MMAGVLHAFFRPALDKPPGVIVQALVTEAAQRSNGIGEALMQAAEGWAREKGCTSVALERQAARRASTHSANTCSPRDHIRPKSFALEACP